MCKGIKHLHDEHLEFSIDERFGYTTSIVTNLAPMTTSVLLQLDYLSYYENIVTKKEFTSKFHVNAVSVGKT